MVLKINKISPDASSIQKVGIFSGNRLQRDLVESISGIQIY